MRTFLEREIFSNTETQRHRELLEGESISVPMIHMIHFPTQRHKGTESYWMLEGWRSEIYFGRDTSRPYPHNGRLK